MLARRSSTQSWTRCLRTMSSRSPTPWWSSKGVACSSSATPECGSSSIVHPSPSLSRVPCCRGRWPSRCCTFWWEPSSTRVDSTPRSSPRCPSGPIRATHGTPFASPISSPCATASVLSKCTNWDRRSDVVEMLFGEGKEDMAGYTAQIPLAHEPGTVFNYSSGTTNVLSRIVADVVGYGDAYRDYIQHRLFDPLGMTSADATFDPTRRVRGVELRARECPRLREVRTVVPARR